MAADGFLNRRGIRALAAKYMQRLAADGHLDGEVADHLAQFGAIVARQVRWEERNWRLLEHDKAHAGKDPA